MRRITSSIMALSFMLCSTAQTDSAYATASDASLVKQIVPLEKQFLGHSFDTDSKEHRLERLENLLFGEVSTGDPASRIEKLDAAAKSASNFEDYAGDSNKKATTAIERKPDKKDQQADKNTSATLDTDDYPRIGALETAILGKTFTNDQLEERLSRIETKAFGKASQSDSLGDRTDALETYAEKKMHKPLIGQHNEEYSDDIESPSQKPSRIPQIVSGLSNAFLGASSLGPYGTGVGGLG
ncbi:MAG: hypothetical protein K8F91_25170, partial [Candidatus Obscuribacterales bacterium]|nr:hypothetical protein [Candidatus Obscuribacterales bacterium]